MKVANGVLFTALLSASQLVHQALSRPNGSPLCQISESAITKAHGVGPLNTGYFLVVKKNSDSTFMIKIQNSKLTSFKGLLMYVEGAKSQKDHLGSFSSKSRFLKSVNKDICARSGIKGRSHSTLTHKTPNAKSLKANGVFTWKPSKGDQAKEPWTLHAIVTNGKSPYQILKTPLA
jgi:hypothetical protein